MLTRNDDYMDDPTFLERAYFPYFDLRYRLLGYNGIQWLIPSLVLNVLMLAILQFGVDGEDDPTWFWLKVIVVPMVLFCWIGMTLMLAGNYRHLRESKARRDQPDS